LIEIARKKTEQSMLKAYQHYKEQLNKEKKNSDKKATKAEKIVNAIFSVENTLKNLDMETMSSDEKSNIFHAADALKTILDEIIANNSLDQTSTIKQPATAIDNQPSTIVT
jgi:predicted nuclease with TOPRIM domain